MAIALSQVVPWPAAWIAAAVAGASLSWNAAVVDGLKQRLRARSIDRELDGHAAGVSGAIDRALFAFMRRYAARIDRAAGAGRGAEPRTFGLAQWVGPTHHHAAIGLAALAAALTTSPLPYAAYFAIAIVPANLWLAGVLATREGKAAPCG
jgi:hypothetical protein